MNIKGMLGDFVNNTLASLLYTGLIQLIVYPLISYIYGIEQFGVILTVMGIVNIMTAVFGSSLNNIRLVKNKEYSNNTDNGDFKTILLVVLVLQSVLSYLIFNFIYSLSFNDTFFLLILINLSICREYGVVIYRQTLNFKRLLKSAIIQSLGLLLGLLFAELNGVWQYIFIISELLTLIYLYISEPILKEKPYISTHIQNTLYAYILLLLSNVVVNSINYMDRLLIFPILGSEHVSIYYAASYVGKSLGLLIMPISSIVLSYYSTGKIKMSKKNYRKQNFLFLIIAFVFWYLTIILSKPLLTLMYPELLLQSLRYVNLANAAIILFMLGNMIQPIILIYAKTKWQLYIQLIYGIFYFIVVIPLITRYNLTGFCFGVLIANGLRYIIMYFLGERIIK